MQVEEIYPLLLGVSHLFQSCRHFSLRASVYYCHVGSQSLCCSAGVHCRVSSANHEHLLAEVHRCVRLRVGSVHEVHSCEIFVRRHYVDGVLSRYVHEVRQSCSASHEESLESLFLELLYGDGLSDDAVCGELHSELPEVFYLHVHNVVGQSELRNSVFQHSTDFVQRFKHVHLVAPFCHVACEA